MGLWRAPKVSTMPKTDPNTTAAPAGHVGSTSELGEPFGYFVPLPFGWCQGEADDIGAVKLYDKSALDAAVAAERERSTSIEASARSVIRTFEALGRTKDLASQARAHHQCEVAMLALEAALNAAGNRLARQGQSG